MRGMQMVRSKLLAAVLSVTALVAPLWSATPAMANKPTQISSRDIGFVCNDVRTDDGAIFMSVDDFSEFDRPDGSILYWVPPETPENTPDATYRSSSLITDQNITRSGYHFEGTLGMEDRDFNPVGTASFSVDMIATGGAEPVGEKSKFGNRNIHDKSTLQFFKIVGSVTLHDGTTFDLTDCIGPDGAPFDRAGRDFITDIRTTDPSQFVIEERDGILVLCDLAGDDFVGALRASAEESGGSGGDLEFTSAGRSLRGDASDVTLTPDVFKATIPLIDLDTEESAGDAVVDATLTRAQRVALRFDRDGQRVKQLGWLLNVSGTLTAPTEPATVIDLSGCLAFDGSLRVTEHRPRE